MMSLRYSLVLEVLPTQFLVASTATVKIFILYNFFSENRQIDTPEVEKQPPENTKMEIESPQKGVQSPESSQMKQCGFCAEMINTKSYRQRL